MKISHPINQHDWNRQVVIEIDIYIEMEIMETIDGIDNSLS